MTALYFVCVLLVAVAVVQAFHFKTPFGSTTVKNSYSTSSTSLAATAKFLITKEKYGGRLDLGSMNEGDSTEYPSQDFFSEAEAEQMDPPKVGQTVTGSIIELDDSGALLEIGGKMSGYLPLKEAVLNPSGSMEDLVEIGQSITAEVIGTLRGMPVISLRSKLLVAAWDKALAMRAADEVFTAVVREVNKGGAVCDILGLKAFLPGSHCVGMPDESMIGTSISVKFLDLVEEEGKVVVSQRLAAASNEVDLELGKVYTARVSGLRPYGAFLEVEGTTQAGLLHVSQISYDRVDDVDTMFQLGQEVKALLLEQDKAKGRLAFSTKVLEREQGEMLRDMQAVFDNAEESAVAYHARNAADRLAREEAAKEIVASLNSAIEESGNDSNNAAAGGEAKMRDGSGDQSSSVSESIESILASIVADAPVE